MQQAFGQFSTRDIRDERNLDQFYEGFHVASPIGQLSLKRLSWIIDHIGKETAMPSQIIDPSAVSQELIVPGTSDAPGSSA